MVTERKPKPEPSALTPELRAFITNVVVPSLEKVYKREHVSVERGRDTRRV